jgi:hypothetical protein
MERDVWIEVIDKVDCEGNRVAGTNSESAFSVAIETRTQEVIALRVYLECIEICAMRRSQE